MRTLLGLVITGFLCGQTPAGRPTILNAKLENKTVDGNLGSQLRSVAPAWFAYAIQTPRKDGWGCCWDGNGQRACNLEPGPRTNIGEPAVAGGPIHLEGTDSATVLFRVENDRVGKIHVYSSDCALDAGGLRFVWLTGVRIDASLALLQKFAGDSGSARNLQNGAIFAISQHDGPQALDLLIEDAKTGPSSQERSQALFWLAQRAGAKASAAISDAITNDPDTQVKKKAVFALSQLPPDEGVPKLIQIARSQKNPEVRKQAFFWLGQSRDARAIAFFEEVLGR
jgi:hypothetical protein